MTRTRDRIAGSLLGAAIGDALGATLEFHRPTDPRQPVHREIVGGGPFGWRKGQGTDDSDLTFALARSYAAGYSLDRLAQDFRAWRPSARDVGGATSRAIERLRRGVLPSQSGGGEDMDAGNGSLMRIAPVGLVEVDREQRHLRAREVSAVTHAESRAIGACLLYSDVLSELVSGKDPERVLDEVLRDETLDRRVKEAAQQGLTSPLDQLKTTPYVLDGLALATWALRRSEEVGPVDALVAVVNRGGDADSNGTIAGALLGAVVGAAAWPSRWRDALEYGPMAEELADVLTERRERPRRRPSRSQRRQYRPWSAEQWRELSRPWERPSPNLSELGMADPSEYDAYRFGDLFLEDPWALDYRDQEDDPWLQSMMEDADIERYADFDEIPDVLDSEQLARLGASGYDLFQDEPGRRRFRCGEPCEDGHACANPVSQSGGRCHYHRGIGITFRDEWGAR